MEQEISILLGDTGRDLQTALSEAARQEGGMRLLGVTGDGEELLRMARAQRPQVVVMDLVLAGLDGLEVLDALKAMAQPPLVLVLSAFLHEGLIQEVSGHGADYLMLKPCGRPRCWSGAAS